jgi:hypothetical protein
MNFWFYVLLIFIVALVLGPIAMLRPKPGQKRKEQLRLRAAGLGVRFGMRRLPALKTDMEAPALMSVYFLPPPVALQSAPDWVLMRTGYEHEGNFYKEWDWQGPVRPPHTIKDKLALLLPGLPCSVPALIQGKSGTCIFWREAEGEETLMELIGVLRDLDQLAADAAVSSASE